MPNRRSLAFVFAFVGLVCLMPHAPAAGADAAKKASAEFMRYSPAGDDGATLDAAIVSYENADGVRVDLVSAVHIADHAFFETLNERFKRYDSVLYEMVKPAGMEMPKPGAPRQDSPVSSLQRMLKNVLDLDFQLDAIDYTADNFVHADLDTETFQQLQQARGETLLTMMLRALMNDLMRPRFGAAAQPLTLEDLLNAAAAPDRARQFKLLLAPQFQDMEAITAGFGDANGESVIITERNKAAIKALQERIAQGDHDLAIFYGAAHLPDMEKRLKELGFERTGSEWLTAWDMRPKETRDSDKQEREQERKHEAPETAPPQVERI